jgi:hypothetical protein
MILNKLAAGVTAIAIATTAISVPAKADNKDLQTLLAILAGGLVINEIIDNKKDRKKVTTSVKRDDYKKPRDKRITHQHRNGEWYTHQNMEELRYYHSKAGRRDRRHDWEYDRDSDRTARDGRRDRKPERVVRRPIQDDILKVERVKKLPLPDRCRREIQKRNGKVKHGYSQRCLQKRGYRIDAHGNVTHHKWSWLTRRPRLM